MTPQLSLTTLSKNFILVNKNASKNKVRVASLLASLLASGLLTSALLVSTGLLSRKPSNKIVEDLNPKLDTQNINKKGIRALISRVSSGLAGRIQIEYLKTIFYSLKELKRMVTDASSVWSIIKDISIAILFCLSYIAWMIVTADT